jgi:hypothetical protein
MGWVKAEVAAKELGVDVELINGLVQGGQLKGETQTGKTGATRFVVDAVSVAEMKLRMAQVGKTSQR